MSMRSDHRPPGMRGMKSSVEGAQSWVTQRAPVVRAQNVHLHYRSRTSGSNIRALDDVTLDVGANEIVTLVGASGCGKTSLLNLFAGLLVPSLGTVHVNGAPPPCPPPGVGYMSARDGLLPWRSVKRNVALGLEHRGGWSRADINDRVSELLEVVGLADFADAYPRQLSQGMRQRVAVARTLAPRPNILLMDEPFAALDAQNRLHLQRQLLGILESEGRDADTSVVFVTHDLQEALLLGDRVVVMLPRPGRIAVDRPVPLPRPRAAALREIIFSDVFRNLHEELYVMLEASASPEEEER